MHRADRFDRNLARLLDGFEAGFDRRPLIPTTDGRQQDRTVMLAPIGWWGCGG